MSIWGHRISVKVIAVVVAMFVVGAFATAVTRSPDREITLVVRGMAFYLLGDPATPNPTITLKAGERVRVVLRNEDRGITHDFAVPAIKAALDQIDWNEEEDVTFDVPETPGRYEYTCRPHTLMMRGTLIVQE
jgi:plastocyanin